ncbi:MAG: energy transducer TonB [Alphaproteobacteria bacterium]|nr:energy transducer TonB [Alphaproteobacteria bacterium]MBU0795685.1 energy transducer TonB [Alphaproteobacteria bacterium]MBU0887308.1 energy transducer TonB [Alphaproteobacteria bacterium]MBU1811811.1 energy transducer TonB [Alphaproteobacteria bacterium]MBU2091032.1 energy transducer TonB [Alphaproteobacteria bacterium]
MRQTFLLWIFLIGGAGVALFLLKYEVQEREEQLARLNSQIIRDQEAIQILRAEWSYLNRPDRLADLARRYLDLEPVTAKVLAASVSALPDPIPVITPDGLPVPPVARSNPLIAAPMEKPQAILATSRRLSE